MSNLVQVSPAPVNAAAVMEHNKAGLGELSVLEYSLGGIDVFDVKNCKGVDGAYYPQHIVSLLKKPFVFDANWEGHRFQNPWNRGNVVFIPAESKLTHQTATPYDETVIRLKDELFVTASRDHVDFDRIDFTFRDITSFATWKFGVGLAGIIMDAEYREWPLLVESASLALVLSIIRELAPNSTDAFGTVKHGLSQQKRKRVLEYVDANLSRKITLADMAGVATLSVYHFSRKFKNQMGMTPTQYVAGRRVEKAKMLLRSTSEPLVAVALACGFASQSHLTGVFKTFMGVTPAAYRLKGR